MPVKRRYAKRRQGDAEELSAWSDLFTCGYDYFHDLKPYGFPTDDADRAARAAAPAAWRRLGAAFMETWQPIPNGRQTPWAVEEFGLPKGYRRAR